ncbi:T9SS type A sorting domain-containing protein [Cyclonatronum proteinivorum]|nr:T9SS type A sorting domain-containing protein [Cyclonatronum proteinivorum]
MAPSSLLFGKQASEAGHIAESEPEEITQDFRNVALLSNLRLMRWVNLFPGQSSGAGLLNNDPLLTEARLQLNVAEPRDGEDDYQNFMRNLYTWENGRISEIITQRSFFSNDWFDEEKQAFGYENDLLRENVYFSWVESIGWEEEVKEEFAYTQIDGQSFISEVSIAEFGDPFLEIFVGYEGTDISKIEEFVTDGTEMQPVGRSEFTYNGEDLFETYSVFDGDEFIPDYRIIYVDTSPSDFYEMITRQLEVLMVSSETLMLLQLDMPGTIEQVWDGAAWVDEFRMLRVDEDMPTEDYDSAVIYTSAFFNEEEGWQPDTRIEIAFNELGQILYGTASEYDIFEEQWIPIGTEVFEYNSSSLVPDLAQFSTFDPFAGEMIDTARLLLEWDLTNVDVRGDEHQLPAGISLGNAYPNPFNPTTNIPFEISETGHVSLEVFDMLGRQVAVLVNEAKPAGSYTVPFDAAALSSGVYLIRLQSGDLMKTSRVTLIK